MGLQANLLGGQLADQYRNLGLLSSLGQQQQRLDQAQLDFDRAEFDRRIDDPFRQLRFLSAAISPISPSVIGRDTRQKSYGFDLGDTEEAGAGLSAVSGFLKGLFT